MLRPEQHAFRERAVALARRLGPDYGIDWRLMAAAAILESGWGESALARRAHNLFGIKATAATPDEGAIVITTPWGRERFRRFESEEQAFRAYGWLLSRSSHYAEARQAAREAALEHFLRHMAPVYCPDDPDYQTKIHQIIEMIE